MRALFLCEHTLDSLALVSMSMSETHADFYRSAASVSRTTVRFIFLVSAHARLTIELHRTRSTSAHRTLLPASPHDYHPLRCVHFNPCPTPHAALEFCARTHFGDHTVTLQPSALHTLPHARSHSNATLACCISGNLHACGDEKGRFGIRVLSTHV